jgi:hypothetical protein
MEPEPLLVSQRQCRNPDPRKPEENGQYYLTEVGTEQTLNEMIFEKKVNPNTCWQPQPSCPLNLELDSFSPNIEETYKAIVEKLTVNTTTPQFPLFAPYQKLCHVTQQILAANNPDQIRQHMALLEQEIMLVPQAPCKQVVLGPLEDLVTYVLYVKCQLALNIPPSFAILAHSEWTEELNKQFVTCASNKGNQMCEFQIRLLLPQDKARLYGATWPRITVKEICILKALSASFDAWQYVGNRTPFHVCLPYRVLFLRNKHLPYVGVEKFMYATPLYGGKLQKVRWHKLLQHFTKKTTKTRRGKRRVKRSRKRT